MTKELIIESQRGYNIATLELIEKFKPILKKYAYKLFYEDAYDELLINFIELVHNINLSNLRNNDEGTLIAYICRSIRNYYIKKSIESQKLNKVILYSELDDKELYYIETLQSISDSYFKYEFPSIENLLTKSESSVIKLIFLSNYSVEKIASMLGVSRQAVNQMKNRALRKLKDCYYTNQI